MICLISLWNWLKQIFKSLNSQRKRKCKGRKEQQTFRNHAVYGSMLTNLGNPNLAIEKVQKNSDLSHRIAKWPGLGNPAIIAGEGDGVGRTAKTGRLFENLGSSWATRSLLFRSPESMTLFCPSPSQQVYSLGRVETLIGAGERGAVSNEGKSPGRERGNKCHVTCQITVLSLLVFRTLRTDLNPPERLFIHWGIYSAYRYWCWGLLNGTATSAFSTMATTNKTHKTLELPTELCTMNELWRITRYLRKTSVILK